MAASGGPVASRAFNYVTCLKIIIIKKKKTHSMDACARLPMGGVRRKHLARQCLFVAILNKRAQHRMILVCVYGGLLPCVMR